MLAHLQHEELMHLYSKTYGASLKCSKDGGIKAIQTT